MKQQKIFQTTVTDHKKNIEKALLNHHEKLFKQQQKQAQKTPRKKNEQPEKDVEKQCLEWMRAKNWEVQIIESKATYNVAAGCYTKNQSVKTGNADCQGLMPDGTSIAVEFKAPGRLSSFLSDRSTPQRDFIIKRIHMNGFACVVDSTARLEKIFVEWDQARQISKDKARQVLLNYLPVRKTEKKDKDFNKEMGF